MQDLSFRRQETREFVSAIANCELDDQSLDHLQEHTEGWPAGLRMILLAAETHKDMASFIRGLTDDPWQIQQYLLEEVLERLSDPIGDMIVRAAMVDSFSAELLNALVSDGTTVVDVTGSTLIETIQRTGLFCVPLDDTGTWFRFHHQFQEILRRRAAAELTDDEARLVHERGGEWFDQSGLTARAVHHYLLAERGDLAGDVVSRDGLAALNKIDFPAVDAALALLPDACIQGSVELKILLAHAATAAGRYSQLMSVVQSLRTALESDRSISKEQSSRIMVLQASLDFLAGNHDEATTTLLREVEQLPVHYTFEHSAALLLLAGSLQTRGNRASALKWLFGALETAPSGVSYYRRRVLVAMCHVYWGCGDLAELVDVASTLLRKYGTEKCAYITVRACWFKAAAQYLRDDVDEAVETLQLVVRNRWWPHLHSYANCTQVLTSAYMAQGDFDKARDTAAELVAQEIEGSATYFLDDALAVQAEVELASGRVANAFRWAMEYENPQLNTPFGFKIPALSAARILLKSASGEGLRKADALIREHELFLDLINSRRFLIEALVLRAIYCAQTGDIDTALERLTRAISLAEPGGFVRVFVDMGPELLPLLSRLSISDTLVIKFVGRIIRALESSDFTARTFGQRDGANRSVLPEYLSRRELEVLRLLSRHLTNKEIGERLFISPATVKRHAHNVYQKLNVTNRREAVAKASGLGIVD
jgi:LuxR family maltose regulon positive regulatory protein